MLAQNLLSRGKLLAENQVLYSGRKKVPEVLNVHMNEIYRKLTTIKLNKLKLLKVFLKITFSFSKLDFLLLEKKKFL